VVFLRYRPDMPGIVIVGTGFGGIGMGIALKKAGYDDFIILDKADDLGGTWRDNQYPGCACDVPSPLYSYSFELNPDWSRLFAPQPEIWDYLRRCARTYGLEAHIRYGSVVERMDWDEGARRWDVQTVEHGELGSWRPRAVVAAAGALHLPVYPDIPGAGRFGGTAFHSSRWDHSADLAGKRVAVIGTGASAIQFVPEIAKQAGQLTVFQRTPPWIHPRPDAPIPARMRTAFRKAPVAARALRDAIYMGLELRALGFAVSPKLMAPLETVARMHLASQVTDPALRARLTPDYTIGCKRILLSSDYYPALQRPNVSLVTEEIAEITEAGVTTADGQEHKADVIIYATGFNAIESVTSLHVSGRDGRKLQPGSLEAYQGITVAGFPNLFLLLGPNTGQGHSSAVFMIESQIQHVLSCLYLLSADQATTIEVSEQAQRRYNDALQRRLRRAVWSEGGCRSWYLDADGVNRTLWPGFTFEYWARTRRARPADYTVLR
jgi:cation diffusion facilitator CzcD-associated flavoprotein CzcO